MSVSIVDRDGRTVEAASPGMAGTALGFGITGTVLGLVKDGILGGLLGGGCGGYGRHGGHGGGEDLIVSGLLAENAKLNGYIYTDNKFECMQKEIACLKTAVAVECQKTADNFAFLNYKEDTNKKEVLEYVKGHYVPGKLVMPLDSICPAAEPVCKPERRDEYDNCR